MADFDEETQLYYSHQQLQQQPGGDNADDDEANNDAALRAAVSSGDAEEDAPVDLQAVRRHFREFLREYEQCCYCCSTAY